MTRDRASIERNLLSAREELRRISESYGARDSYTQELKELELENYIYGLEQELLSLSETGEQM
jgi:hypothetical protein